MTATPDHLLYRPIGDIANQIEKAQRFLDDCARVYPRLLRFFLEPSNLLAIAGLRAESPYATFGDQILALPSTKFTSFMEKHNLILIKEERYYVAAEAEPAYLLINRVALDAIPNRYRAAKRWWLGSPVALDYLNYTDWYTQSIAAIVQEFTAGRMPQEWLADWWAPHNVLFGMLLGYPGSAICSSCRADELSARTTPALTRIGFTYPECSGTEVSYEALVVDSVAHEVGDHQRAWQSFFDEIYRASGYRTDLVTPNAA